MPGPIRLVTTWTQFAAGLLIAAGSASAQTPTLFQGLRHAALGSAILRLDPSRDVLEVSNLTAGGTDGLAIDLGGNATQWTATVEVVALRSVPLQMTLEAIAEGRRISTASLRQVGDRFALAPTFTGALKPTYSAQVHNDGRLVRALGGVLPTAHVIVPIEICSFFPDLFECRFTIRFHNAGDTACVWTAVFEQPVDIVLPDGVIARGNELRLVEEVRPAARYPYIGFDATAVLGNAHSLNVLRESVR